MDAGMMSARVVHQDERWLYRVGGLAALVIAVAYVVIVGLYARVGAPPVGGQAWLEYLSGKTGLWWAIVGISVFTNFLFVPVAFSLYFALRNINRNAVLIGVAFIGLFVALELAVNWSCYTSLIMLSGDYASATDAAERTSYIAAANYPSAFIASPLALVYAVGTLSFGFLVVGFVMLRGVFNKITAYVGIFTGIIGILAVLGLSIAVILNALSAIIWLVLVGVRLYRLD